jgi:dihydrofolate reductase
VQAPGGVKEDTDNGFRHGGWSMRFFDPEVMGPAMGEIQAETDAILQGRRTFQVMQAAWPARAGDEFADWINQIPKYVVSDTLQDSDITWQPATILRGADLVPELTRLREQPGGVLSLMGSASLVRTLFAHDLVDEMLLMIEPIALGGGKTIFPADGEARPFELISTKAASTGVVVCRYRRAG